MVTVSLVQAKAHLSELVDKVEAGEEVVVTRHARVKRASIKPDIASRFRTNDVMGHAMRRLA